MTRATRMREEQSLHLFRQELELIKEKQEYRATDCYRNENDVFQIPGRVLHMDGDPNYLKNAWPLMKKSVFRFMAYTVWKKKCPKKSQH